MFSPDYVEMDRKSAMRDFELRLKNYEKTYEEISDKCEVERYGFCNVWIMVNRNDSKWMVVDWCKSMVDTLPNICNVALYGNLSPPKTVPMKVRPIQI